MLKYLFCISLLTVTCGLSLRGVLVTCTIFPNIAGKKVYLFGDNHTSAYTQQDADQLYAFQQCVQAAVANDSSIHIYCELPCNRYYYRDIYNPKVTASLVPFIRTLPNTGNLVAQDIEMRGPAIAADFLLTRTVMLKHRLEDMLFTTNGIAISLATLTFDILLNHVDALERQVKLQHLAIFGNQHTNILTTDCAISQENRQQLLQQLQVLGLKPTSLILEVSRLLVGQSKLEQRQELLQTIHNTIDPLFRLALMHKIYTAPTEKVVVVAGYLHTNVLLYYFKQLGFAGQNFGSSAYCEEAPVPLDNAYCIFN